MLPVHVDPLHRPVLGVLRTMGRPAMIDEQLRALGAAHRDALLTSRPGVFDGPVLCWQRTVDNTLEVAEGSYFDMVATCDALRVEADSDQGSAAGRPLLGRVLALTPDPLVCGAGRAAALGVTVVLMRGTGPGASFLVGRRAPDLALDAGAWHAFPAGMVEPHDGADPLIGSIAAELAEEVGLRLGLQHIAATAKTLGVVHDLRRLRPDVVVMLRLGEDEWASRRPPSELEMSSSRWVSCTADGLRAFWQQAVLDGITAPLAGSLVLLERSAIVVTR